MSSEPHPLARIDGHLWTLALLTGFQLALLAKIGAAAQDARRLEHQRRAHFDEQLEHHGVRPARTIIAPPAGPAEVREP